ncbi:MAG TPA: YcjX family protein [Devosiaceae bacterium]
MPKSPITITDEIGIALGNLADAATSPLTPTLRLGVTGLSRAGKTIFITALVHNLLNGTRLPGFAPLTEGRLIGVRLDEHEDHAVPRFAYEQHLGSLTGPEPAWPESTRRISQLRLTLKYQSRNWIGGLVGPSQMHLDIVDYPGEWLLDLPLLNLSYAQWSREALERAERVKDAEARPFFEAMSAIDATAEATEPAAEALATAFAAYLRESRKDGRALSTLPPGRFLMPGDLEGSPALTFAPLPPLPGHTDRRSLHAMLERRYEAYRRLVVRPFFRDHFARLDRQIVLVDTLRALNVGPDAVADLESAITAVMACFRQGSGNPVSRLLSRRIDRILFAATKADHLHHTSHDRLQAILERMVARAARRSRYHGARTASMAIAAIRATREGTIEDKGEKLPCIVGTPQAGEHLGNITYDGKTEIALFPGDLPGDPESVFQEGSVPVPLHFLRFNPPGGLSRSGDGAVVLPHIRLDRALDFLIGDWLK